MSRFYDCDSYDNPIANVWESRVRRVLNGKRGQKILREFIDALLALPTRRLVADALATKEGDVCAIGALAVHRGITPAAGGGYDETIETGERDLGIGFVLSWQLAYMNDEHFKPLRQYRRHVRLDVPVLEEVHHGWRAARPSRPREIFKVSVPASMEGYTPEERWQAMYAWAVSQVRWNLPASVAA